MSTASKALHGRPRVSEETRDRVLRLASELGYVPNTSARSLVTGRSGAIGLITSDLSGNFSTPILIGAEDEVGKSFGTVLLCNARGDAELEREKVRSLVASNVEGIIVVNALPDPRPPLEAPVPVVYAYAPSTRPTDCAVVFDNVAAGRLAVDTLLAAGRRRVVIIGGEPSHQAAQGRLAGALAALSGHGLAPAAPALLEAWTFAWGREATQRLLHERVAFDALVCQSDLIARGALDALASAGRQVPHDVAVIGHDNWALLAAGTSPRLTTIDNELGGLGALAARLLTAAIHGEPAPGLHRVRGTLVAGESV